VSIVSHGEKHIESVYVDADVTIDAPRGG